LEISIHFNLGNNPITQLGSSLQQEAAYIVFSYWHDVVTLEHCQLQNCMLLQWY